MLRAVASHARRSVFIPISGIFMALGLLFVALPKISAYVLAALCAWLALGPAARLSAGGWIDSIAI